MAKIDKIYIVSNAQGFQSPINKSVLDKIDLAADIVTNNDLSLSGIDLALTEPSNPIFQGKAFSTLPTVLIVEQTSSYLKTYKRLSGADLTSQNIASSLIEVLESEEGSQVDSAGGGFINYFNGDFVFGFNIPSFAWLILAAVGGYKSLSANSTYGRIGFGAVGVYAANKYYQS